MRENRIESNLKREVEKVGGECEKWVSPGKNGMPDRICFFPSGKVCFVETKAPGEKPRPLQEVRIDRLKELGQTVFVVSSLEHVREVIEYGVSSKELSKCRD